MFRFIELLGLVVLLWFIINFIHYAVWAMDSIGIRRSKCRTTSGFEGPRGFVFGMSSSWIKSAQQQKKKGRVK